MVTELLKPVRFDEIKRRQLIDLSICNGTYRHDDPINDVNYVPTSFHHRHQHATLVKTVKIGFPLDVSQPPPLL